MVLVSSAQADQHDRRLDTLFPRLLRASSISEVHKLQARIWSIWYETTNRAARRLFFTSTQKMQIGDIRGALRDLDELVRVAPDFAEGWNRRATLYYLIGDYQASLSDINHTLALEPRHFGALSGLGLIEAERGNDRAAIDAFERVLQINPHDTPAMGNLLILKKRLAKKSI
jgi:tetratricopeptide (TPR) repeat protein